jgi:hypothetical protein
LPTFLFLLGADVVEEVKVVGQQAEGQGGRHRLDMVREQPQEVAVVLRGAGLFLFRPLAACAGMAEAPTAMPQSWVTLSGSGGHRRWHRRYPLSAKARWRTQR